MGLVTCPGCGEENPDRFRLCGFCGTALAPTPVPVEIRKTVTVVFSDLAGSTALGERLDSEALREVLNLYFREMQAVLQRHGGTVEKFIGDAVMAVFGLPRLHEDDALRAVRAAAEMQATLVRVNERLLAEYGVELTNRTGVNTGEVVAGDVTTGQRLVTGDVVNTAARLEQAAPAHQILLGGSTYRLVRDAVEVEAVEPLPLKGKAEPVPAYRLLGVRGGEAVTRHLDRPMVGRAAELAALESALVEARDSGRPQLVTVVGPAGVGKSRLLDEFLHHAEGQAATVQGRCLNYGEGITFFPLAEIVRGAAGIDDEDDREQAIEKLRAIVPGDDGRIVDRMAVAIGLSEAPYRVEELFWGAARLLEALAAERPLVVLINDLHWAEGVLLDLLGHVLETARRPIVIVGSARPEMLEEHPDWATGRAGSRAIVLEPLTAEESGLVIANLLGTSAIDDRVRERIAHSAQGNPLFVEQMLSMLIDDGVLVETDDGWVTVGEIDDVIVPPSISALLAARLDRLGAGERLIIEHASIVGQVFEPDALRALSVSDPGSPEVGATLAALSRKQLVEPDPTSTAVEAAYRFVHILIRDAAYAGILKRRRAELHERCADWMLGTAGTRVGELSEIIGYHLEQSVVYRRELAPLDEAGLALAARASERLAFAGRRAFARGDMPAAANLLRRAAALIPPGTRGRADLLIGAGEALTEAGALAEAETALAEAVAEAELQSDTITGATASIVRRHLHYATEGGDAEIVRTETAADIAVLEAAGDDAGLLRGYRLITLVEWTVGRFAAAERASMATLDHARRTGDTVMVQRFVSLRAISVMFGPTPAAEGIEIAEELLRLAGDDSKSKGLVLGILAHLRAMLGEFVAARDLYRRSRAILEEHGWQLYAATVSLDSGPVELLAGDVEAAIRELRHDHEALERLGERNYIATVAAYLAEALEVRGEAAEAERLTEFVESIAAADDYTPQFTWRLVRGLIRADQGDLADAERLVRGALEVVEPTDDIDAQGDVLLALATIIERAGRHDEAEAVASEALRRYEAKGNLVLADRARSWRATEVAASAAD